MSEQQYADPTITKTKKVAKPKKVAPELAPQTEGPALSVHPAVAKLCETPLILDPVKSLDPILFKCVAPKGTSWVQLHRNDLMMYSRESHTGTINRKTLTDVTFHAAEVREHAGYCGGGYTRNQIGYASGKVLSSGTVDPQAQTYVVKFNRQTGEFSVDGHVIIGAEVMILGDNCIGLVINPQFKH